MYVYCCSIELENRLQTATTVDSGYLRYVTSRYLLTYIT